MMRTYFIWITSEMSCLTMLFCVPFLLGLGGGCIRLGLHVPITYVDDVELVNLAAPGNPYANSLSIKKLFHHGKYFDTWEFTRI